MKKIIIFYALIIAITSILLSCKKNSTPGSGGSNNIVSGTTLNTWTFTAGSTVHNGTIANLGAELNTLLQGNNTYTFTLLGFENSNNYVFDILLSLNDTTFTTPTYQSGSAVSNELTAFYYTATIGGNSIYESSNFTQDIGAVMTYTISSYNASTGVLVLTFTGQSKDANGSNVNITNGKVTCTISKL